MDENRVVSKGQHAWTGLVLCLMGPEESDLSELLTQPQNVTGDQYCEEVHNLSQTLLQKHPDSRYFYSLQEKIVNNWVASKEESTFRCRIPSIAETSYSTMINIFIHTYVLVFYNFCKNSSQCAYYFSIYKNGY